MIRKLRGSWHQKRALVCAVAVMPDAMVNTPKNAEVGDHSDRFSGGIGLLIRPTFTAVHNFLSPCAISYSGVDGPPSPYMMLMHCLKRSQQPLRCDPHYAPQSRLRLPYLSAPDWVLMQVSNVEFGYHVSLVASCWAAIVFIKIEVILHLDSHIVDHLATIPVECRCIPERSFGSRKFSKPCSANIRNLLETP